MENKRKKNNNSNIVSFIPNGEYYFQKALKALERNEMDTAYKFIKRAAELSPDDAQILLQYSILELEAQNFDVAYELIHTAYSIDPNDEEILFFGDIKNKNDKDAVIKFLEKYNMRALFIENKELTDIGSALIL